MMIDTHVHLRSVDKKELETQIEQARSLGTRTFIEVSSSTAQVPGIIELANSRDGFFFGVAVHPYRVESYDPSKDLPLLRKAIHDNQKLICIGECGLDYVSPQVTPAVADEQRLLFRDMIRLAREHGLPLNLHSERKSVEDLVEIMKQEKAYEVGGIIHNFQGNLDTAREFLDLGFYLSVFTILLHPRAERLRRVFQEISMGQIVLGTDSPAAKLIRDAGDDEPFPFDMDKQCEPRVLRYICDKLADLKGVPAQDVEAITTLNAQRAFNWFNLKA